MKEEQKLDVHLIKTFNSGHYEVVGEESCSCSIYLSPDNFFTRRVSGHGSIEQILAYEIRIHVKRFVVPPEENPSTAKKKILNDTSVLIVETLAGGRNDP